MDVSMCTDGKKGERTLVRIRGDLSAHKQTAEKEKNDAS
jgi:hypothetical protein